MARLALGIEYKGTAFGGWQRQASPAYTAQAALEQALTKIADHPITVTCAGRTDRGVHALGQVVHFDTEVKRVDQAWTLGVNSELPNDLRVTWLQTMPSDFHARYSATARCYHYIVYNQRLRPGLWCDYLTWHRVPLALAPMQEAAHYLVGAHDFSSFRAAECQALTAQRTIEYIIIKQQGPFFIFEIKANAFLHHMVRNIVGSLMVVGEDKQPASWLETVLKAHDRSQAGPTAAANGLYLTAVDYPEHFQVPKITPVFPLPLFERDEV